MLHISRLFCFTATAICLAGTAIAQTAPATANTEKTTKAITQNVRGVVIDAESKQPLTGVVVILMSDRQVNAVTDSNGYFNLPNIPVGRHSFQFTMMGFEPYTVSEAMVISGKEQELNVTMNESLNKLTEVTVKANKERTKPLNEFATVSARSFSVEETRRYAASFADPARMVMNFPGVSNGGDMDNSIVVRGNSPKGVLWRLEGIEIPNPNHFSPMGASGGAISMLNANVLGNSDFYTGAFAPEIGNATAGVFDINFRNGSTDKYEHTVQIGTLGAELSTEGPFKKGKRASYLINYRYSTLALLGNFINIGDYVPKYQDASIKLNFPTEKAGTFTLFGLGGYNVAKRDAPSDTSKWDEGEGNVSFDNYSGMGVAGISHQYFVKKDAYIKTIVSASYDKSQQNADTLNPADNFHTIPVQRTGSSNTAIRASVMYNQKLSARNTFRTGIVGQQMSYDMKYDFFDKTDNKWKNILSGDGSTQFYQAYGQLKSRLNTHLTMVAGLHASYLALNGKYSIEPRTSFAYQLNKNKFTLAAGLHSKPEHISTYLYHKEAQGQPITYPNKDLDLLRSLHTVAGYETRLPGKVNMKVEVYYQHLYNIPVEKDTASAFSIINAQDVYSLLETTSPLVSEGKGDNYGVDLSFERPFMNNYYVLATGSLYKSTYTNYKGDVYNTRYNRGYQLNLIGGKEFRLNASGKKIIGLNGKALYSGGLRESQIDLAASKLNNKQEVVPGKYFTEKAPAYFRADASIYYKVNNRRATHSVTLEVQNLTNHENYYYSYYDRDDQTIKRVKQLGILPNISYRIDFHW